MAAVLVDFSISRDELLRMYRGSAHTVSAIAIDGRRIQFPAQALRAFVTQDGISGRFRIEFDQNNKLLSVTPL